MIPAEMVEIYQNINQENTDSVATQFGSVNYSLSDAYPRDTAELIRLALLDPDEIEGIVTFLTEQMIAGMEKDAPSDEIASMVKERIFSDAFVYKLVPSFQEAFSHEEILSLILCFKNDAVKKYFSLENELMQPLFEAIGTVIEEVLEPLPSKVAILSDEPADPLMITEANYQELALGSDIPVVIDVYTDWCAPCKDMAPIIDELGQSLSGKIKFLKLNAAEEATLANDLNIKAVPTFLLIKDGQIVKRLTGAMDQTALMIEIIKFL